MLALNSTDNFCVDKLCSTRVCQTPGGMQIQQQRKERHSVIQRGWNAKIALSGNSAWTWRMNVCWRKLYVSTWHTSNVRAECVYRNTRGIIACCNRAHKHAKWLHKTHSVHWGKLSKLNKRLVVGAALKEIRPGAECQMECDMVIQIFVLPL